MRKNVSKVSSKSIRKMVPTILTKERRLTNKSLLLYSSIALLELFVISVYRN